MARAPHSEQRLAAFRALIARRLLLPASEARGSSQRWSSVDAMVAWMRGGAARIDVATIKHGAGADHPRRRFCARRSAETL